MVRLISITAAFVMALGAAAFAGGLQTPQVVGNVIVADGPDPRGEWTGFYVGVGIGNFEFDEDGLSDDTRSTMLYGGYLHDFGRVVAGGELYFANMEDYDGAFAGSEDSEVGLRARLGYDLGRVLPYATVGMTRFDSTAYTESDTYFGYGLGAEVQVTDRFRLGAEYYLGANDEFVPPDGPTDVETERLSLRATFNF